MNDGEVGKLMLYLKGGAAAGGGALAAKLKSAKGGGAVGLVGWFGSDYFADWYKGCKGRGMTLFGWRMFYANTTMQVAQWAWFRCS